MFAMEPFPPQVLTSAPTSAAIMKSENALKQYNEQLEIEANRNNIAQINELSKKISQVKQEIEDLYSQYAE
jgi:TolA-binding protein